MTLDGRTRGWHAGDDPEKAAHGQDQFVWRYGWDASATWGSEHGCSIRRHNGTELTGLRLSRQYERTHISCCPLCQAELSLVFIRTSLSEARADSLPGSDLFCGCRRCGV